MISSLALEPCASAPPTSSWNLGTARLCATLRAVSKKSRRAFPDFAKTALESIEKGDITSDTLLSSFTLRLAKTHLPNKYSTYEAQERLKQTLLAPSAQHRRGTLRTYATHVFFNIVFDRSLAPLLVERPDPTHFESDGAKQSWENIYSKLNQNLAFSIAVLKYLSEGENSLAAIDALVHHFTPLNSVQQPHLYKEFMFVAAQSGAWNIVKLLLESGRAQIDDEGIDYLGYLDLLMDAPGTYNLAGECDLLLQTERKNLLHIAAEQGDVETLEYLHAKLPGAALWIDKADGMNRTPLFYAVQKSHLSATVWLLDHGASVGDQSVGNHCSLLHVVNDVHIAALLIKHGVNVNATDFLGGSPLAWHCRNPKMVQLLITAGADVKAQGLRAFRSAESSEVHTMLVKAGLDLDKALIEESRPDVVKLLLQAGARPNATNDLGETALHHAGDEEIVTLLVQAGANLRAVDHNGTSVLASQYFRCGLWGATDLYVASARTNQLNTFTQLLNEPGPTGRTLLHQLVHALCGDLTLPSIPEPRLFLRLTEVVNAVQQFAEWGADLHAKDRAGLSAYDCVCQHLASVRQLLDDAETCRAEDPERQSFLSRLVVTNTILTKLAALLQPSQSDASGNTHVEKKQKTPE